MPILNLTPEQEEALRETELQERRDADAVRAEKYAHEYKLAQLKSAVDGRHATIQAICKAFTFPLTVACVTILTLAKREVPQVLQDFLRL